MRAFSELPLTASTTTDQATRLSLLLLRSTLLPEIASTRCYCFLHHLLAAVAVAPAALQDVSNVCLSRRETTFLLWVQISPELLLQSSLPLPKFVWGNFPSQMF